LCLRSNRLITRIGKQQDAYGKDAGPYTLHLINFIKAFYAVTEVFSNFGDLQGDNFDLNKDNFLKILPLIASLQICVRQNCSKNENTF
jgi:uncharacterized membrane protein YjdF